MRALPIIVTAAVLTGCVAEDNPNRRATLGAAIGALSGAVLGHQVNHGSGKWVGALAGALAGGAVGHYMDNQQREFEAALERERQAHALEIERLQDETLRLIVVTTKPSSTSSATPTAQGQRTTTRICHTDALRT